MTPEEVQAFLAASKRRGIPVGLFGAQDNARNFRCWEYALPTTELPRTERLIQVTNAGFVQCVCVCARARVCVYR